MQCTPALLRTRSFVLLADCSVGLWICQFSAVYKFSEYLEVLEWHALTHTRALHTVNHVSRETKCRLSTVVWAIRIQLVLPQVAVTGATFSRSRLLTTAAHVTKIRTTEEISAMWLHRRKKATRKVTRAFPVWHWQAERLPGPWRTIRFSLSGVTSSCMARLRRVHTVRSDTAPQVYAPGFW